MKRVMILGAVAAVALVCNSAYATTIFGGTAIGSWDNVVPESHGEYTIANNDAGGFAKVTWGDPAGWSDDPSYLKFDGAGSDGNNVPPAWSSANDPFLVGIMDFYNGVIDANSGIKGVDLDVKVDITTPDAMPLSTFTYQMGILNTINPAGDKVIVLNDPGSVQFDYAGSVYEFDMLGFAVENCGHWEYVTELFAREDRCEQAKLYGKITYKGTPPPPPVPDGGATVLLLGLGLVGLRAAKVKLG